MKQIISILLTAILLLGCCVSALAEEFQLRNGIMFGDTLEAVKSKETLTIQSSSVDKTNNVWFDGKIAGMDGSVRFDFDEETGKLTEMLYSFKTRSTKDSVDSEYSTLYQSLVRKYGNPLGNTGGNMHLITGEAIESAATIIALYMIIGGTGDFRDYDEWIVDCGSYNVKIDLISYYYRTKDYDYTYGNKLSYHYYTNEDYLSAIQDKLNENAAIDNDL